MTALYHRRMTSAEVIIGDVCAAWNISRADMMGRSKKHRYVVPRQIAMYLVRRFTSLSLPAMGRKFGKNHSTICHGVQRVAALVVDESTGRLVRLDGDSR